VEFRRISLTGFRSCASRSQTGASQSRQSTDLVDGCGALEGVEEGGLEDERGFLSLGPGDCPAPFSFTLTRKGEMTECIDSPGIVTGRFLGSGWDHRETTVDNILLSDYQKDDRDEIDLVEKEADFKSS
ncbi:hypothetical protein Tco_0475160, partial [Tanacetum coccineum]